MSELIIRLTGQDTTLLPRLTSASPGANPPPIGRIVIDAPTAAKTTALRDEARRTGLPYLIDPLTFYLADHQHPAMLGPGCRSPTRMPSPWPT